MDGMLATSRLRSLRMVAAFPGRRDEVVKQTFSCQAPAVDEVDMSARGFRGTRRGGGGMGADTADLSCANRMRRS
jgi:hypothetical protein